MRAVLRFLASVLVTSGLLVIGDAVLTLTWEEPVTSFFASRAQAGLGAELRRELPRLAAEEHALARIRDINARLAKLAALGRRQARSGHAIGRIELTTLHRSYYIVQGTDTSSLTKGPGHYASSPFPGQGGTIAIAGHRTTYLAPFRPIDGLRRGDPIVLSMPYGRFTYVLTSLRVVLPTDLAVLRPVGYEQLVLTSCDPPYSASHRIVAFARLRNEAPN